MDPLLSLSPKLHAPLPDLDQALKIPQATLEALREPALARQGELLRSKVEHIVVLMLENRSFDHLLGWLGPKNGGLSGKESNPQPGYSTGTGTGRVNVFQVADTSLPISPPHAGNATFLQINGGEMDGFLRVFIPNRTEEIAEAPDVEGHPPSHIPMAYYGQETLPACRHLVEHHTVCTRYHASVPAGTWPNRMYLYAGSSNGLFGNGSALPRNDTYDDQMPKKLLVDLLTEAKVDWAVYAHGIAWMRLFKGRFEGPLDKTHEFRRFDEHCRRGNLPAVSFIDPNWADLGYEVTANDDLAPCDLMNGQRLIAEVYNSLRELPDEQFERTLFVVTYDEHGGFFDHVAPGRTLGANSSETDPRFATYGVRVPTFVVSPYAPAGLANHLLDHASLHATIHRTFLPGVRLLSGRAQVADTFATLLTLDEPRPKPPAMDVPSRRDQRKADPEHWRADREERRDRLHEKREDRREDRQEKRQDRREARQEDPAVRSGERQQPRTSRADAEDGGLRAWVRSLRETLSPPG